MPYVWEGDVGDPFSDSAAYGQMTDIMAQPMCKWMVSQNHNIITCAETTLSSCRHYLTTQCVILSHIEQLLRC